MTKLTDTHLVILSAAAKRDDRAVILPERLKGHAAQTTAERLIGRGLIEEVAAHGPMPAWRNDEQGAFALRITDAGLRAIGIEPEPDPDSTELGSAAGEDQPASGERGAPPARSERSGQPRPGTKQALVVEMLSREQGASLNELVAATGWLAHTTRAALTGLRQRRHALTRTKDASGGTVYRIQAPESAGSSEQGA